MKNLLILLSALLMASCSTSTVKLIDKYEKGAFVEIPEYIEALEINGRRIKKSYFSDKTKLEIPVGRSELVVRYAQIFDTHHGDSHERVESEKMTLVFVAAEGETYKVSSKNPDDLKKALKLLPNLKIEMNHEESGTKTIAVRGEVKTENELGAVVKKPYNELKYWWVRATAQEKENFLKWSKEN